MEKIRQFIADSTWVFAKTYAKTAPHHYIIRTSQNAQGFDLLAKHIDDNGVPRKFYSKEFIYLDLDGYSYWHMGNVINRVKI